MSDGKFDSIFVKAITHRGHTVHVAFFLFLNDFLLVKTVVGSYFVCLGMLGNLSHIAPVLIFLVCAAQCQLPSLGLVMDGHFSREEIISHFVLGAKPGLALGVVWVQYPHDARRFEAFIENPVTV